jgi:sortase A
MTSTIARISMRLLAALLALAALGSFGWYAWQQWGVNFFSDKAQVSQASDIGQQWASAPLPERPKDWQVPVLAGEIEQHEVFARLFIPSFGPDYVRPIASGTDTVEVLNKIGVGHYSQTARPGAIGNFAVAAHRMTYGAAFEDLDLLNPGDEIIVETADGWYTYLVDRQQIVDPTEVSVIAPVPGEPGVLPTERWMTLTTCTPKWSVEKRLIVFAKLDSFQPRWDGAPEVIAAQIDALDG